MKLAKDKVLTTMVSGTLLIAVGTTIASGSDYEERRLQSRANLVPLETVMTNVIAQRRGHVIKHELERKDAGYVYEIKTVDDQGIVWEMAYDAQTGKLLNLEPSEDVAQRYYGRSRDDRSHDGRSHDDESNDHVSRSEDDKSDDRIARRHY
jgi:uncharacterized membrane protein YkoI